MDSLGIFKGYGRVAEHLEDQISQPRPHPGRNPKRLAAIIALSCIFLLTLILCALIVALINESEFESEFESPSDSIRSICSVTRHPESCASSISAMNAPASDPELVFLLSLRVAMIELSKLASLPGNMSSKVNDAPSKAALGDCRELLDDAASRLRDSASAMATRVGPAGEQQQLLDKGRMGDLRAWIAGAMTDLETCVEGLEETRSAAADEVKGAVREAGVYMSNSLAILANMESLLRKFHLSLH